MEEKEAATSALQFYYFKSKLYRSLLVSSLESVRIPCGNTWTVIEVPSRWWRIWGPQWGDAIQQRANKYVVSCRFLHLPFKFQSCCAETPTLLAHNFLSTRWGGWKVELGKTKRLTAAHVHLGWNTVSNDPSQFATPCRCALLRARIAVRDDCLRKYWE